MSETVGARMKNFRENKEVRLEKLACRTGLDQNFLAAVEEGHLSFIISPWGRCSRWPGA
ncbi:hypothetical protein DFAR_570034 [Desulfarculales bacterium]